jgi:hypothetical protein
LGSFSLSSIFSVAVSSNSGCTSIISGSTLSFVSSFSTASSVGSVLASATSSVSAFDTGGSCVSSIGSLGFSNSFSAAGVLLLLAGSIETSAFLCFSSSVGMTSIVGTSTTGSSGCELYAGGGRRSMIG